MTAAHQPGSEIAGYRIESLIGRGGMAVVYRAEDMRLGRKVALKLLPPLLADSEQFRQRFMRESRLAASLDHPNIVPIFEAGEADGQLFIAMRYVLGSDLKGLLAEEGGPLPVDRTLRLFVQIGDALDTAHRAGLVHRDVKPANILVAAGREHPPQGHGDHVYLTDFGLTKRTSDLSGGLTGTGHFLGTVDYVSPEQIQGKPAGPGTDIYALGCVLYECLTGQLPFRREDDAALLWAHLVETPPPITGIRSEIPAEVNAVVARAMAKDPADRYQSCEEFLRELELALGMPAPVSSPRARPTGNSGAAKHRADVTSDSSWAEPGTVTGDMLGGNEHPSFPSGPPPPFLPRSNASYDSAPPADHEAELEEEYLELEGYPESDQDDAASDREQGDREQGDRESGDRDEGDWEQGDRDEGDWEQGDWDEGDWDEGEPAAPPAQPAWRRRWRIVALVAAAVLLVAVAAVVLRSWLSVDYRTYTSDLTVVPFQLDRPADWDSRAGLASDIILGPDPTAAANLFFNKGSPEDWASTADTVRSGSPGAIGLYVYSSATTYDTSDVEAFRASITPLLPNAMGFESAPRQVTVAGAPADEMDGVTSDPEHPQTRLRVLVDVVQPPGAGGAVLLAFFAPPDTFEDHLPTFEKIRDSLQITR